MSYHAEYYRFHLFPCSLIKILYYMCKKSRLPPTGPQLEHAIKRNFGGLEIDVLDPYEMFLKYIPENQELPEMPHRVTTIN